MYVLGIDAGGTKTVCLLADERGHVLDESRGDGANLQASGELQLEKVLHEVMEQVLTDGIRPSAICLGIAGMDRPADEAAVRGIMRRIGSQARILVVNDALIALVAGAGDAPGVVIVAGTGSIAYGRNGAGLAARAGGWGYLLGDEGGGFWLGRAAVSAVVRQFDGRGPATCLTELLLERMQLDAPSSLVHEIYSRDVGRRAIAALAPLVQIARDRGDAVAAEILSGAGSELAGAAATVITRLNMRGDAFPTVLAGGVFKGVPWLSADVTDRLREVAPRSVVSPLAVEPALGAVHLALAASRGQAMVPAYV